MRIYEVQSNLISEATETSCYKAMGHGIEGKVYFELGKEFDLHSSS